MRELDNKEVVVFCLDDQSVRGQYHFTKRMDVAAALGELHCPVTSTIGMYKGELEAGYLMTVQDYINHKVGDEFCNRQEAVLVINSDSSSYLATPELGMLEPLGRMHQVDGLQGEAWTYVAATKRYFTTR